MPTASGCSRCSQRVATAVTSSRQLSTVTKALDQAGFVLVAAGLTWCLSELHSITDSL